MAAADNGPTFDADTAERVLDEHRSTFPEVEALFRVHIGEATAEDVGIETIAGALTRLNYTLCLAVHRDKGTEYLHAQDGEDGRKWYSLTEYPHRTLGPLPFYPHNVADCITQHPVETVKVTQSPYAGRELPSHNLDENEVNLDG